MASENVVLAVVPLTVGAVTGLLIWIIKLHCSRKVVLKNTPSQVRRITRIMTEEPMMTPTMTPTRLSLHLPGEADSATTPPPQCGPPLPPRRYAFAATSAATSADQKAPEADDSELSLLEQIRAVLAQWAERRRLKRADELPSAAATAAAAAAIEVRDAQPQALDSPV